MVQFIYYKLNGRDDVMELTENLKATRKKKGFTLIELMIVLAIIAILAIILVPKASIFKNQAKDSGVTTNVNAVRAYLQTKVTNENGNIEYLSTSDLKDAFVNSFKLKSSGNSSIWNLKGDTSAKADETIMNPIDNSAYSVVITNKNLSTKNLVPGSVVIFISSTNGYTVYGVDDGGNKMTSFTVK
jgi:type IV pilus assembly protein PilA